MGWIQMPHGGLKMAGRLGQGVRTYSSGGAGLVLTAFKRCGSETTVRYEAMWGGQPRWSAGLSLPRPAAKRVSGQRSRGAGARELRAFGLGLIDCPVPQKDVRHAACFGTGQYIRGRTQGRGWFHAIRDVAGREAHT